MVRRTDLRDSDWSRRVGQQDRDLLRRLEVEQLELKGEGVLERAGDVWREERLGRREVDEVQVHRLDRRQLRRARRRPQEQDDERGDEGKPRPQCEMPYCEIA